MVKSLSKEYILLYRVPILSYRRFWGTMQLQSPHDWAVEYITMLCYKWQRYEYGKTMRWLKAAPIKNNKLLSPQKDQVQNYWNNSTKVLLLFVSLTFKGERQLFYWRANLVVEKSENDFSQLNVSNSETKVPFPTTLFVDISPFSDDVLHLYLFYLNILEQETNCQRILLCNDVHFRAQILSFVYSLPASSRVLAVLCRFEFHFYCPRSISSFPTLFVIICSILRCFGYLLCILLNGSLLMILSDFY